MDSIPIPPDLVPYFEKILSSKGIACGTTRNDDGSMTFFFPANNKPDEQDVLAWVEEAKELFQRDQGV